MAKSVLGRVGRWLRLGAAAAIVLLGSACASWSWFNQTPPSKMTAEQLYAEAQNELASGNWARAREQLNPQPWRLYAISAVQTAMIIGLFFWR